MTWVSLSEHNAACSVDNFYSGVNVWLQRPNVVNKRLLGAVTLLEERYLTISTRSSDQDKVVDDVERGRQALLALAQLYGEERQREDFSCKDKRQQGCDSHHQGEPWLKGVLRQLLPKMRSASKAWEAVLIDESNHSVTFCPLSSLEPPNSIPECSYRLRFSPASSQDPASSSRYPEYSVRDYDINF